MGQKLSQPRSPPAPGSAAAELGGTTTQPCTCRTPLAACAGARSPSAWGSPAGTAGAGRGEGRTRQNLPTAPCHSLQSFFFPQSQQHPPANIRARLKAVYGLDRTHSVLCMWPPWCGGQPGWTQSQKGDLMLHLLPQCSAPLRMGPGGSRWANKAPSGHHMPGTTVAELSCAPHTQRCPKPPCWVL